MLFFYFWEYYPFKLSHDAVKYQIQKLFAFTMEIYGTCMASKLPSSWRETSVKDLKNIFEQNIKFFNINWLSKPNNVHSIGTEIRKVMLCGHLQSRLLCTYMEQMLPTGIALKESSQSRIAYYYSKHHQVWLPFPIYVARIHLIVIVVTQCCW